MGFIGSYFLCSFNSKTYKRIKYFRSQQNVPSVRLLVLLGEERQIRVLIYRKVRRILVIWRIHQSILLWRLIQVEDYLMDWSSFKRILFVHAWQLRRVLALRTVLCIHYLVRVALFSALLLFEIRLICAIKNRHACNNWIAFNHSNLVSIFISGSNWLCSCRSVKFSLRISPVWW